MNAEEFHALYVDSQNSIVGHFVCDHVSGTAIRSKRNCLEHEPLHAEIDVTSGNIKLLQLFPFAAAEVLVEIGKALRSAVWSLFDAGLITCVNISFFPKSCCQLVYRLLIRHCLVTARVSKRVAIISYLF